jgi:hypothetical protein
VPARAGEVLAIERGPAALGAALGLALATRANASRHGPPEAYFDAASYATANAVYGGDLRRFGYPMRGGA